MSCGKVGNSVQKHAILFLFTAWQDRLALKRLLACISTANLDISCDFNDDAAKPIRLILWWVGIITECFKKATRRRINTGHMDQLFFLNKGQLIPVPAVKALWTSRGVNLPIRPQSAPDENAASHVPTALTCKKQPSVPTERGRDSSVGIATRYGLEVPGIESRWGGGDFPHPSRPTLGTIQPLYTRYTAFGMWWHTVKHGRGSEGETGKWSG